MATRNRHRFLPQAIRCFLRQTYPNRELLVVDDSTRPAAELCEGLPRVRYLRLTRATPTGAKLNLGIEAARGELIQKLDDDDFYHQDFLATSVRYLPAGRPETTLVTRCCFLILMPDRVVRHSGHGWTAGGAFCFHRAVWERRPFRDLPRSEDRWFLRDHNPRLIRICDPEQYIVVRHGRNTWGEMSTGDTADAWLSRCRPYRATLAELVPAPDARFYRALFPRPSPRRRTAR
jgi:glycosyltransferase involved in cell wall biosynthesis